MFSYVLIPADESEPMREIRMEEPTELEANIGCLTQALQEYYRRHAPVTTAEGKAAMLESVRATMKEKQPDAPAPDEGLLGQLASSQTVDIVLLLPATPASDFIGVNLYVDDKGVAKGSAVNARASAICAECGKPTEVRGDAFVAKLWDDQDGFVRHSVTLADLASDAAWVLKARQINAVSTDPGQAEAKLRASIGAKPPEPPGQPLSERLPMAEAARAAGTSAFKGGDMEGAAARYEEAAALLTEVEDQLTWSDVPAALLTAATAQLVPILVNLAACRLRQERPYDVIAACDRALVLDEGAAKAWFRRGQACMSIQQFGTARKNLHRAATLLPQAREVRDALEECKALAAQRPAMDFSAMEE